MDWDGQTHFWRGLLIAPFYIVWKLLSLITALVRRLFLDVVKDVYGKIVLVASAAVFAILAAYFSGFLKLLK